MNPHCIIIINELNQKCFEVKVRFISDFAYSCTDVQIVATEDFTLNPKVYLALFIAPLQRLAANCANGLP